uniref:N-alpha-acetyltransferase 60 n=1 Tax=Lynceus sp. MCZ IZ 141354 TaxID=1930659 RepID=A0A9N6ZHC0_9CRUS|nr:EOG090X0BM0 [Lynceus sp. MCZ IZ 141354]
MSNLSWYGSTSATCLTPSLGSSAELQLRFLCPEDIDEVKHLCEEWFPIKYPQSWYKDVTSDPRFYSLAAVYKGELVGLFIAEIKHCSAINKEDTDIIDQTLNPNCYVGYILSLGVATQYRQQGVASLLLNAFLSHLVQNEQRHVKCVYLHVLTTNSAAIKFYEKRSFRLHTFLPYYYSVNGRAKDGFTYVIYINGGHPPWTLLDYLKHMCSLVYRLTSWLPFSSQVS